MVFRPEILGCFVRKESTNPLGKKRLFEFRLPMAGHLQHEVYRPPGGGCVFFCVACRMLKPRSALESMDYILVQ